MEWCSVFGYFDRIYGVVLVLERWEVIVLHFILSCSNFDISVLLYGCAFGLSSVAAEVVVYSQVIFIGS